MKEYKSAVDFVYDISKDAAASCFFTPLQETIIRTFYGDVIKDQDLISGPKIKEIQSKFKIPSSGGPYRELVCGWGRRSGKTYVASRIAAYEAYRALHKSIEEQLERSITSSGSNLRFVKTEKTILFLAPSKVQARIGLSEVKNFLLNSYLVNDVDIYIASNWVELKKNGFCSKIVFESYKSDSLLGKDVFSLIIDEPEQLVSESVINTFNPTISSNGGVVVLIGTKYYEDSIFGQRLKQYKDGVLTSIAATWEVREELTRESLRESAASLTDEFFEAEFGSKFRNHTDEDTEQITLRVSSGILKDLKKLARYRSYKSDKDLTYTDIIRDLIDEELRKEKENKIL